MQRVIFTILFVFSILIPISVSAQSAVVTAGGSISSATYQYSYSIGQVAVACNRTVEYTLSEGVSATNTKSEIKEFIRQGVENGDWIILGCHVYRYEISDVLDETSMTTANLFDIISYANSLCPIRPTSAVWRERKFLFDINGR